MAKYFSYIFIFIFLIAGYPVTASTDSTSSFKLVDTTFLKLKAPTELQEKKAFDDSELHYNVKTKYDPGFFERFLNWLSDLIFGDNNFDNLVLTRKVIMWTVILISVGVIIWLLTKTDLTRLIKPESKMTAFNFNELTDDLSTINFDKMINESLANNDLRSAIRWHYLRSLFLLEKGKYLVFEPSKTNIDYKNDLRKTPFQNDFIALSRIYEYVWYGKFEIDLKKYDDFNNEFKRFDAQLNVQG
ncbi:MAG: hypothetical protein ACK50A_12115 [Sphingobacteriaceae bacterium]